MRLSVSSFGDFRCMHCHGIVSSAHFLSGVNNRNHCPYCLWSCHLDLYAAGDRLSACKGQMKPIGLTMKNSRNKYRLDKRGELMLVHRCVDCGRLSINRIAADDNSSTIITIFQASIEDQVHILCDEYGILVLTIKDAEVLYQQLYGKAAMPVGAWLTK
jgi:hypothetical protein